MRTLTERLRAPRRAFTLILICLALTILPTLFLLHSLRRRVIEKHSMTKSYRERLMLLPRDGVVMAGGETVAVTYWRGVGAGDWDVIGTGGGWPGAALPSEIEKYLNSGRRVFVDTDKRWWTPCGWQLAEVRQLVQLQTGFRFRRISDGDAGKAQSWNAPCEMPHNHAADRAQSGNGDTGHSHAISW